MPELSPIVLFVYNRPRHTELCLNSLLKNDLADQSTLYIYADGQKVNSSPQEIENIKEVRKIIRKKKWCGSVEIIERNNNIGIGNSTINGIYETIHNYGKVIVLEDDLILSVGFLKFMNDSLKLYENAENVMHISGYMHPVKANLPETFFYNATSCWGWSTWARAWKSFTSDSNLLLNRLIATSRIPEFTMDNKNYFLNLLQENALIEKQSKIAEDIRRETGWNWDVCWHTSVFLSKGHCLHPHTSLVRNIGNDGSGVHCKSGWWSRIYNTQKMIRNIHSERIEISENQKARKAVKEFYMSLEQPPTWTKLKEKLKLILIK